MEAGDPERIEGRAGRLQGPEHFDRRLLPLRLEGGATRPGAKPGEGVVDPVRRVGDAVERREFVDESKEASAGLRLRRVEGALPRPADGEEDGAERVGEGGPRPFDGKLAHRAPPRRQDALELRRTPLVDARAPPLEGEARATRGQELGIHPRACEVLALPAGDERRGEEATGERPVHIRARLTEKLEREVDQRSLREGRCVGDLERRPPPRVDAGSELVEEDLPHPRGPRREVGDHHADAKGRIVLEGASAPLRGGAELVVGVDGAYPADVARQLRGRRVEDAQHAARFEGGGEGTHPRRRQIEADEVDALGEIAPRRHGVDDAREDPHVVDPATFGEACPHVASPRDETLRLGGKSPARERGVLARPLREETVRVEDTLEARAVEAQLAPLRRDRRLPERLLLPARQRQLTRPERVPLLAPPRADREHARRRCTRVGRGQGTST